jgi:hypothetical protein
MSRAIRAARLASGGASCAATVADEMKIAASAINAVRMSPHSLVNLKKVRSSSVKSIRRLIGS